jgi:DNA-binding transcriptional MerR regulator
MSDADDADDKGRPRKAPTAFRTISEVADDLNIPQHVLRFWESKFPQLKPLKRGGGRRYYRPEDIALLKRVGDLLYNQGYTIKGVQRLLRDGTDEGPGPVALELPLGDPPPAAEASEAVALKAALAELEDIARALHRLAA